MCEHNVSLENQDDHPLEPITLNGFGEKLCEHFVSRHRRDDEKLSDIYPIGIHAICDGFLDFRPVSDSHNIILCRDCGLRIPIPKSITVIFNS